MKEHPGHSALHLYPSSVSDESKSLVYILQGINFLDFQDECMLGELPDCLGSSGDLITYYTNFEIMLLFSDLISLHLLWTPILLQFLNAFGFYRAKLFFFLYFFRYSCQAFSTIWFDLHASSVCFPYTYIDTLWFGVAGNFLDLLKKKIVFSLFWLGF